MQNDNPHPEMRFFCDLDHTLIYSRRVALGGEKVVVERLNGKEQSFMTRMTYEFLKKQNHLDFIPVTTRSETQFNRLTVFQNDELYKYALICNGGVLLVDGKEDKTWYKETLTLISQEVSELNKVRSIVQELLPSTEIHDVRELFFYIKHDSPCQFAIQLTQLALSASVCILHDCHKVYCLPSTLNKGMAIQRFENRYGCTKTIAAGDSEFDSPMLSRVDIAIVPVNVEWQINSQNVIVIADTIFSDGICRYLNTKRKEELISMNNMELGYSVGALLYSPALNRKITTSILSGQFEDNYSIALCLEDTIVDSAVGHALNQMEKNFATLHTAFITQNVVLPKIFVRVRNPEQVKEVFRRISPYVDIFAGFIFPKYSVINADIYNTEFEKVLEESPKKFYMMPILESEDIIDYASRPAVLAQLKNKIDAMKEHVLNVRVGGNDFSNAFGLRRHIDETIYDILPISQLLCDILTVFSRDYVVSGPVWEYYSSSNKEWVEGLKRELNLDVLNGFVGKTVIHPNQIPFVAESLKVKKQDYDDAMEILSWSSDKELLVGGSAQKERMNEVNTHLRWAKKTVALASIYGVQE